MFMKLYESMHSGQCFYNKYTNETLDMSNFESKIQKFIFISNVCLMLF